MTEEFFPETFAIFPDFLKFPGFLVFPDSGISDLPLKKFLEQQIILVYLAKIVDVKRNYHVNFITVHKFEFYTFWCKEEDTKFWKQ